MNKLLLLLAAVVVSSTTTGCATVFASRTDGYRVTSNVPGAEVRVNGAPVGRTPMTVAIDRKAPEMVEVSSPGFLSHVCQPRMTAGGGWVLVDSLICLAAFPFGCITFIDATGAWNGLERESCNANLEPAPPGAPYAAAPGYAPPVPAYAPPYAPQAANAGYVPPLPNP